jgi:hypothetical protein
VRRLAYILVWRSRELIATTRKSHTPKAFKRSIDVAPRRASLRST